MGNCQTFFEKEKNVDKSRLVQVHQNKRKRLQKENGFSKTDKESYPH